MLEKLQLALVILEAHQSEEALAVLDRLASGLENNAALHLYRALALSDLERWSEAQDCLTRLKEVCPGNQFLPTLECFLHLGQGRLPEAIQSLQLDKPLGLITWFRPELATFGPLLSRLLYQLESFLLPLEVPELKAGGAHQEPVALELPPVQVSLAALGRSVAGLYWQNRGTKWWERAIAEDDDQKRQVLFEKAEQAQRRAVANEPHQFRAHYHLGEALLYASTPPGLEGADQLRLEEADRCLLHSWSQDGPNPYLFYYLGRVAQLRGRPEAAKGYLERALEKFEKFPEAHYALGQLHLLMGERDRALDWLKLSVSSDFLPVARDRLLDLAKFQEKGRLSSRPGLPQWPPPAHPDELVQAGPPAEEPLSSADETEALDPAVPPDATD